MCISLARDSFKQVDNAIVRILVCFADSQGRRPCSRGSAASRLTVRSTVVWDSRLLQQVADIENMYVLDSCYGILL